MNLTYGDSRAQAYSVYLALKMSLPRRIKFGSSLLREENKQEDLFRVCKFRSLVKNRLALFAQAYTHTHTQKNFGFGLTGLRFVFWFSSKTSSYHFVCVSTHIRASIVYRNLFLCVLSFDLSSIHFSVS